MNLLNEREFGLIRCFSFIREKPLSMYIFSNDKNSVERILNFTSCGNVCINDTLLQILGKFK
jgi:acyl-CoA reductase-like NAD-dependent aldehyde dehydrogenase